MANSVEQFEHQVKASLNDDNCPSQGVSTLPTDSVCESHLFEKNALCECSSPSRQCSSASRVTIARNEIISQYPLLVSFIASNLVYLLTLVSLKTCHPNSGRNHIRNLVHGSISAIISVLVTTPLWVAKSRLHTKKSTNVNCGKCANKSSMQLIQENNLLKELVLIGRGEGLSGLWSGCSSSILLASINSPLQTIVYEALHRQLPRGDNRMRHEARLSTLATIISLMVVSRCTSTAITYPLWLVHTRQRHHELESNSASSLSIMQQIVKEQGPSGLFKGIKLKLLQTSILAGLLAFTHPKVLVHMFRMYKGRSILHKGISK